MQRLVFLVLSVVVVAAVQRILAAKAALSVLNRSPDSTQCRGRQDRCVVFDLNRMSCALDAHCNDAPQLRPIEVQGACNRGLRYRRLRPRLPLDAKMAVCRDVVDTLVPRTAVDADALKRTSLAPNIAVCSIPIRVDDPFARRGRSRYRFRR